MPLPHKIRWVSLMDRNKHLGKVMDLKRSDSGDRWEAPIILSGGGINEYSSDQTGKREQRHQPSSATQS